MATISITIPDDKAAEVRDALCDTYGYSTESGLTKAQFSKKVVADFVKEVYRVYMGAKAAESARINAESAIKAVDIN
jgi:hypothetical protein